jgi:hypothetical protein
LRQAAFRFHILEDGNCTRADEASFRELAALLQSKSGAVAAEIDPDAATFSFYFRVGTAETACGGPPWAIIEEPSREERNPDPRLDAVSNQEGFVGVSNDEAEPSDKQFQAVRQATGLVWRQFMVRAFDRAVSMGPSCFTHARPR